MNRTKIEWTRNEDGTPGYTWNPITGCLGGCYEVSCKRKKLVSFAVWKRTKKPINCEECLKIMEAT